MGRRRRNSQHHGRGTRGGCKGCSCESCIDIRTTRAADGVEQAKVAEEEADDERVAAFAPGDEDPASKAPVQKHATYYPGTFVLFL